MNELPDFIFDQRITEIALAFHCEKYGKIGFLKEIMSVYRQHYNGLWTGADRFMQWQMKINSREIVKRISNECWKPRIQIIIDELIKEKPISEDNFIIKKR